jgi:NDP-sugar pyrophosphorylase family protein
MSKTAVILAGGKGTRLRPYTVAIPKPLVPIGDYPILEIIIRQLKRHGFTEIVMTVNHLAELIRAFCGSGERWGVSIRYSFEDEPLGTMGPIRLIRDLPKDFLIMNGDVLSDLNFARLFDFHCSQSKIFTIASATRTDVCRYGVLEVDDKASLVGFREKPAFKYQVSMGVYIANRAILDVIPTERPYGFDNLMLELIQRETPAGVWKHEGEWLDIGIPDDHQRATDAFLANPEKFLSNETVEDSSKRREHVA